MSEIKNKIKTSIADPAAESRKVTLQTGIVIKANEKSNTCNVSYIRNDGKKINEENVPLLLNNISNMMWFPKEKEEVLIQIRENNVYILGPSYRQYNTIRDKIKLKHDIFTDTNTDTLGGFIF